MKEIILDTLLDGLKLIPFLFLTFFIMELFEHKFNNKTKEYINKAGKFSPIIGSLLGLIPQCGFSVMSTNLYITRVISLGTLFSIYLSTSDEMLPIMISEKVDIKIILLILLIKFICGIIFGYIVDYLFFKKKRSNYDYKVCNKIHCDCEHSIIKSTIKHTLNTLLFVVVISFIINILFEKCGIVFIEKIFMKNNIFGPFVGSLIGLIPNCGASVALTQMFVKGAINFGTCISGLLTGSGVAILLLFKSNSNLKENVFIVFTLYLVGVLVGIFIELISILI